MLDESRDLDHRTLGHRLDLFHLQEEAPGMVFWHPRGYALYRALEAVVREWTANDGFEEVRTPEPANCPGHAQIVRRRSLSHRDLPLRLAEFGVVHRDEPSGALHGLLRLRQFTQDDGHVFLAESDVEREVAQFCRSLADFYEALGFSEIVVNFATRPAQRAGSDEAWNRAERALDHAARRAGLRCRTKPGEGAFYGPKLEFELLDRLGRSWQCGTIQLDFVLPERFDLSYDDSTGKRRRPAMLHRAILGSLERFLAILLEHHGGRVPEWLAPEQVRVLPVHREQAAYADGLVARLRERGLRATADSGEATLARRIAKAHELCVPRVWIVGAREIGQGTVAERAFDTEPRSLPVVSALEAAARGAAPPATRRTSEGMNAFSD